MLNGSSEIIFCLQLVANFRDHETCLLPVAYDKDKWTQHSGIHCKPIKSKAYLKETSQLPTAEFTKEE